MYVEVLLGVGDRNGGCQMRMEKGVEDGGGAVKGDGGRGSEVQCSAASAHIISAGDVSAGRSLCRSAGSSGPPVSSMYLVWLRTQCVYIHENICIKLRK